VIISDKELALESNLFSKLYRLIVGESKRGISW